jgi:hypothetical protein
MESKRKEPEAPRTALKQTEKNYTQPTGKQHAEDRTLNQGKEFPPQASSKQDNPGRSSHPHCNLHGAHLMSPYNLFTYLL